MKEAERKSFIKKSLSSQVKAVRGIEKTLDFNFFKALKLLDGREGKIIITGVGKSGYIGMKFVATLMSLGQQAVFLHPVEALHGDAGIVSDKDVIIALSFSGESMEVVKIVKYLKKAFKIKIVSITGNKNSSLAEMADHHVCLNVKEEGSPLELAPMSSTTATLVVCDLIASGLSSNLKFKKEHFAKYHPGGSLGLSLQKVSNVMFKGEDIPIVKTTDLLPVILETMSSKTRKGIAAVIDSKGIIKGVVSDGDIRRFLMNGSDNKKISAKDMMTKKPKTISDQKNLKEALAMMEDIKITSLFVVDRNKKVKGFLHMHQIIEDYIV